MAWAKLALTRCCREARSWSREINVSRINPLVGPPQRPRRSGKMADGVYLEDIALREIEGA